MSCPWATNEPHFYLTTDSNNYLRFINGYCLVESEYMMKKAYYTENPTVQERGEGNTFNKWKSKMNKLNVTRDDNNAVHKLLLRNI